MKQIEELAYYLGELLDEAGDLRDKPDEAFVQGFEAGFRKAREMAAELAADMSDTRYYEQRLGQIRQLGEDEA